MECVRTARLHLKEKLYNLMILDVILPKKQGDTPTPKTGLTLLNDVHHNVKYIEPEKIIGITVSEKDIEEFRSAFEEKTSIVLVAEQSDQIWIEKIISSIESIKLRKLQISSINKENILITIHGIRTYGKWQENIKCIFDGYPLKWEYYSIKYGFFNIFYFLVPFFRKKLVKKIHLDLDSVIRNNLNKNIHIIAHSFGTNIAFDYCIQMENANFKIKTLIFAGSVLPIDYVTKNPLRDKVDYFINDCGQNDWVLIFNKLFVPKLSDAGRIGFSFPHSAKQCNRFFKGGHSLYFHKDFYNKYWVPYLLRLNENIEPIDERTTKVYSDFLEPLLDIVSKLKIITIPILVIYVTTSVYKYFIN